MSYDSSTRFVAGCAGLALCLTACGPGLHDQSDSGAVTTAQDGGSVSQASEDGSEVQATVQRPASLELLSQRDVTPAGSPANRPDVTLVGGELWLAYNTGGRGLRLQRYDTALVAQGAATELVAAQGELATDVRVGRSGELFWYAAETVSMPDDCSHHFLNAAVYQPTTPPAQKLAATHLATGCPTSPAFIQQPSALPTKPEAVDDPTPFFHRGTRYVLTRAWPLAKPVHHLRRLDEQLAVAAETLLDTSALVPNRQLGQNVLLHIDGKPFLVGGFQSGPPMPPNTSELYALELTDDLQGFAGAAIRLSVPATYAYRVTRARHVNGTLILNYVDMQPQTTREYLALFDVRNGFAFLSQMQVQDHQVVDNHSSFEVLDDRLVLFQQQDGEKLSMKAFRLRPRP